MKAIVPLNIAALRVSYADAAQVANSFKGRTALFEDMPYGPDATQASTGDQILRALDSNSSAKDPLRPGLHLHWELPDYFRRGVQSGQGGKVAFPQVPNRWLVIRYLSVWDPQASKYGDVRATSWVVESDYLFVAPPNDGSIVRPAVTVPLPANPASGAQPFRYMGRVVDAQSFDPGSEAASDFLRGQVGADGNPLFLTSVGFVGPAFSSYYPECAGIFGFWDHFGDTPDVHNAITQNNPIRFKAAYQVVGWIDQASADPLAGIAAAVGAEYNDYVKRCRAENVTVDRTPADVFVQIAARRFNWRFSAAGISASLKSDQTLDQLNAPAGTLCAGIAQEIVWDSLKNPQSVTFLGNPDARDSGSPDSAAAQWSDTVEVAVGNTTIEALSALLKTDVGDTSTDPDVRENYEFLLDALQLGLLQTIEQQGDVLIGLEEALHAKAFSQVGGGLAWTVRDQPIDGGASADDGESTLPPQLALTLHNLNQAQKDYDQGRQALDARRKQLFMDWVRFVKLYVQENRGSGNGQDSNVTTADDLMDFVATQSPPSELSTVTDADAATGVLAYGRDAATGAIVAINGPQTGASLAQKVWQQYQALSAALAKANSNRTAAAWQLQAVPAPPFFVPTDPVLLVEGDRIAPVMRNGRDPVIAVRLDGDLLSVLKVACKNANFTIDLARLAGKPAVPAHAPPEAAAVVNEAYAVVPMLAAAVANALAQQAGTDNPAVASHDAFVAALRQAQGGLSPADGTATGLYETVHADGYVAAANPAQTVTAPLAVTFAFTNAAAAGWAPHPVAWTAQAALPQFSASRLDPFLPAFLVWSATLEPLRRSSGRNYGPTSLTDYFELDAIDYGYRSGDKGPVQFTSGGSVTYTGAIALSKRSTLSLSQQIDSYLANNPNDPAAADLRKARDTYNGRKILSQALSGFNVEQTLRSYIPQVPLRNLPLGEMDSLTTQIGAAISDDWYAGRFNSVTPIAKTPLAQNNFGPLRAGFARIATLEIVDVFGQRMRLVTSGVDQDGSLHAIVAANLAPSANDQANATAIYLPPRILAPTRLWFRWLSAAHNGPGESADYVELNSHPATSPVCGWILPDHLDDSLIFYDSDGTALGSFGIEHGAVKYRTAAGNLHNPADDLATDIGSAGAPLVNPHLAAFMRRVDGAAAAFLRDLLSTIEASEAFIQPAAGAQDASLAMLIGRPLALARAVVSLETSGGVLPLDQADTDPGDPFPQDVKNSRYDYFDRQRAGAAALQTVQFPLRLGDLPKMDDGVVGFMIDAADAANPYGTLWSAAAPTPGGNGVTHPDAATLQLTLNAAPTTVTLLIDPRAPVHASTGVLPVAALTIPPDQYVSTLRRLAATFFTHPVLARRQNLIVPLPQEAGYAWSWVSPGATEAPLKAQAADEFAAYDYSPQQVLEGWLKLQPGSDSQSGG